jgi:hypothetical protein
MLLLFPPILYPVVKDIVAVLSDPGAIHFQTNYTCIYLVIVLFLENGKIPASTYNFL